MCFLLTLVLSSLIFAIPKSSKLKIVQCYKRSRKEILPPSVKLSCRRKIREFYQDFDEAFNLLTLNKFVDVTDDGTPIKHILMKIENESSVVLKRYYAMYNGLTLG